MREQLCRPEFKGVEQTALKIFDASGGGALCVYVDGVPVVDIWAGWRDRASGLKWEHDTMAMSWSTTKGIASTVVHMLVDQGHLDYDTPMVSVWPEFGRNGKSEITIGHVLAMEAGLYDIRSLITDPTLMLDHDAMAGLLAEATPAHPAGQANAYHALTYGWLVGEVVRRATGSSLGSVVSTEIADALNLDGCYVGTPSEELPRVAVRPTLKPESPFVRRAAKSLDPVLRLSGFSPKRFAAAFLPRHGHRVIGTDDFLQAEVPSANGVFTARSLARIYAALGSDDGLDGVRLWSPGRRGLATKTQNNRRDLVIPLKVGWKLGYHPPFPRRKASPTAFGFYGAYGSGAFADPSRGLAVGFVVQEAKGTPLAKLGPAITAAVDRR